MRPGFKLRCPPRWIRRREQGPRSVRWAVTFGRVGRRMGVHVVNPKEETRVVALSQEDFGEARQQSRSIDGAFVDQRWEERHQRVLQKRELVSLLQQL